MTIWRTSDFYACNCRAGIFSFYVLFYTFTFYMSFFCIFQSSKLLFQMAVLPDFYIFIYLCVCVVVHLITDRYMVGVQFFVHSCACASCGRYMLCVCVFRHSCVHFFVIVWFQSMQRYHRLFVRIMLVHHILRQTVIAYYSITMHVQMINLLCFNGQKVD